MPTKASTLQNTHTHTITRTPSRLDYEEDKVVLEL